MHDLPAGPMLLALARDVLLNDLMPSLPHEARLDARLVANSMAIAEREAAAGDGPLQDIVGELEIFSGEGGDPGPSAQRREETETRTARAGKSADRLRRFAHDLRAGAFESSQQRDRDARAILWRFTLAKLRQANPRFLAANGLG